MAAPDVGVAVMDVVDQRALRTAYRHPRFFNGLMFITLCILSAFYQKLIDSWFPDSGLLLFIVVVAVTVFALWINDLYPQRNLPLPEKQM
jgi:4-hydroxybenzoate polyprenyltransferase